MRQLAAIIVAFFLIAASAPIVACVTGVRATEQESACCRAMRGQCQQTKTNCCRVEVWTNQSPQESPVASSHHLPPSVQWIRVPVLLATPARNFVQMQAWQALSPPVFPAAGINILRI